MSETMIATAMATGMSDEELERWMADAGLEAFVVASCPLPGCEACDPQPLVEAA